MRILIASAGHPHHDSALDVGLLMARRLKAAPTIITVIRDERARQGVGSFHERVLLEIRQWCASAASVIRMGQPAAEIVRHSLSSPVDMIVVGAKGSGSQLQKGMGSTATWIVAHAPCPVTVAKGKMSDLRRLLLCVSAADSPDLRGATLNKMISSGANSLEVTVLHVMSQIAAAPGTADRWQLDADANTLILEHTPEGVRIQKDVGALLNSGAMVHAKVRHGLVVDEVIAESREGSYDLIVIGANQNRGWKRFLLDNLEHRIATASETPIMIL